MARSVIPSTTHVAGDPGHVTDSNNIAKYLSIMRNEQIFLDEYTDTGDNAKLAAAIADQAAAPFGPPIKLTSRTHTFTNPLGEPPDGFTLTGSSFGIQSSASSNRANSVTMNTGATPWITTGVDPFTFNTHIQNIFFTSSDHTTQFLRSPVNQAIWAASLRDLSFQGFAGVLGNSTESCRVDLIELGGSWSVLTCWDTPFNMAGSDCRALWTNGWLNIGSGDQGPSAGHGGGLYLMKFNLAKCVAGNIYVSADNGWRGMQFTGSASSGYGMIMRDSVIEGRNVTNTALNGTACDGNLIKITGGQISLRDNVVGFGMANPSAGEHGLIEISGTDTEVFINGLFAYTHSSATNVTGNGLGNGVGCPIVYVSGTPGQVKVRIRNVAASERNGGAAWGAQKPVVQQTVAGLVVDSDPDEIDLRTGP